jgi:hypothetical protein
MLQNIFKPFFSFIFYPAIKILEVKSIKQYENGTIC